MKKFIDINIFNIFLKYFLFIRILTDLVDGAVPLIEITRPSNVIATFAAFYKTNNRWMSNDRWIPPKHWLLTWCLQIVCNLTMKMKFTCVLYLGKLKGRWWFIGIKCGWNSSQGQKVKSWSKIKTINTGFMLGFRDLEIFWFPRKRNFVN